MSCSVYSCAVCLNVESPSASCCPFPPSSCLTGRIDRLRQNISNRINDFLNGGVKWKEGADLSRSVIAPSGMSTHIQLSVCTAHTCPHHHYPNHHRLWRSSQPSSTKTTECTHNERGVYYHHSLRRLLGLLKQQRKPMASLDQEQMYPRPKSMDQRMFVPDSARLPIDLFPGFKQLNAQGFIVYDATG
eukprot:GHVU01060271.1.p1 GENE.GHVU01060271.1~~GHVU01060271.1.p1  ORF type:complete len:188 (+),score=13.56 GHVU01060271.1:747-1310(+)